MSVIVRGMEMPKSCGECFACKAELSQEKKVIYVCCFTREEYVSGENRVETDCPLIHVPPHGRLIDEKDIPKDGYIIADGMACIPVKDIVNAPAIIEAEEGE